MASEEIYKKAMLLTVQSSPSDQITALSAQQISVSRTEANLVFTNEREERCSKRHPLSQPTTDADGPSK